MADKPSDFLVSVINFFGVVLPGALLTYVFLVVFSLRGAQVTNTLPHLGDSSQQWVAFVVVSYLLGHFISLIGASLDSLCDRFYILGRVFKDMDLFERAKEVANNLLGRIEVAENVNAGESEGNGKDKVLKAIKKTSRWANTFLRLASADAALQLDQLEADSKFFRSLSIVLVVCLFICGGYFFHVGFWPLALCIFLLILSCWRYANLRWKRTRLSYEFLVALACADKLKGLSEKGKGRCCINGGE